MEEYVKPGTQDVSYPATAGSSSAKYAWIEFSDMHLGSGSFEEYRRGLPLRQKLGLIARGRFREAFVTRLEPVVNPLEDFYYDVQFGRVLDGFRSRHAGAERCTLVLNGDCFDPLAVAHDGRIEDPNDESAQVGKARKIARGHPAYFEAIRRHVMLPNCHVVIIPGNHDQHLDFLGVQRVYLDAMTGGDPALKARVIIADCRHRRPHEWFEDGLLFKHGHCAEPFNGVDPKTSIMNRRFGIKLKEPLLNKPIGSDMAVRISNRIKQKNALVGRVRKESQVWLHAIRHDWWWGVYHAGTALLLFNLSELRKLSWTRLKAAAQAVRGTIEPYPVKPHARKLFEQMPGTEIVVCGHDHHAAKEGWYINAGTWTRQYRIDESKNHPFARHLLKTALWTFALFGVLAVVAPQFVDTERPMRWLIGIAIALAALPTVRGIIKVFTVKPEITEDPLLTFVTIERGRDGQLRKDVMIYDYVTHEIREYL